MEPIGLPEAIETIRGQLRTAIEQGAEADIQFPISSVELEFQISITREKTASGGLKVWVVEAGAEATRGTEEVHTVTVTLGTPVTRDGRPVRVHRHSVDGPDR